jgi:hypothetical protein
MLYLERNFIWRLNLDISKTKSEIPEKFAIVVLEKDGEEQ